MEDQISKNLMYLNNERIRADFKYRGSLYNKLRNFLLLLKLIFNGNLEYALYRIRNYGKEKPQNIDNSNEIIDVCEKIAVYTVIFGDYDKLYEPLYKDNNCDYFVVTNNSFTKYDTWIPIIIDDNDPICKGMSNLEKARFYKLHPHILFPEYKYSIFIDGNIQIVSSIIPFINLLKNNFIASHMQPGRDCVYQEATQIIVSGKAKKEDVKKQISTYKMENFPKHFGMFQTNVLVREHNNIQCQKLMNVWWNQINKYTKRDQLSLTYSLWRLGYSKEDVSIIGNSSYQNSRLFIHEHK